MAILLRVSAIARQRCFLLAIARQRCLLYYLTRLPCHQPIKVVDVGVRFSGFTWLSRLSAVPSTVASRISVVICSHISLPRSSSVVRREFARDVARYGKTWCDMMQNNVVEQKTKSKATKCDVMVLRGGLRKRMVWVWERAGQSNDTVMRGEGEGGCVVPAFPLVRWSYKGVSHSHRTVTLRSLGYQLVLVTE